MFQIPNEASAAFGDQALVHSVDFTILGSGHGNTGVVTGCGVTAQGTPNMTVAVAAGSIAVTGAEVAVAGGNVTITAANATNPRFDLIVASSAGALSAVAGTPAAQPTFPAIPAASVVLAVVYVPANDTAINTNQIIDKAVPVGYSTLTPIPKTLGQMASFPAGTAPGRWYFVTDDNGGALWNDDGNTMRKTLGLNATLAGTVTVVRKTAETTRASTAAVSDDPHLTIPIGINKNMIITGMLFVYGAEAGDFQWIPTVPTGAAGVYHHIGMDLAATGGALIGSIRSGAQVFGSGNALKSGVSTLANTPGGLGIPIRILVRNGATAGSVTIQWAQNVSNATATALMVDSWIEGREF